MFPRVRHQFVEVFVREAEERRFERRGERVQVVAVPEEVEGMYQGLDLVLFVEADASDHAEGDALYLEGRLVLLEPGPGLNEDRAVAVSGRALLPDILPDVAVIRAKLCPRMVLSGGRNPTTFHKR